MPVSSDASPLGFPATRQSIVAALGADDPAVRTPAFETLIAAYWKPVYKYLRVSRRAEHEQAQDLTQEFFERAMKKPVLGLVLGGVLGVFDGLSALVTAPETVSQIGSIVGGSTFKVCSPGR